MQETEEIKNRLPIEQVVGKYVPLKRAGRIFRGLCPFHNEKTPSFTVNPERGIYKCFGCSKGGDIFDFTMEIEGLTFPEALKLLAEQAGVVLEEKTGQQPVQSGPSKVTLYGLNTYVAKLWHTILAQHPKAQPARDYLLARGLTPDSIINFQIGFAPTSSTTLAGLQKAGFSSADIRAAGDPSKFQNRITFPIADITGRIVGFTGRIFQPESENQGPKYWNTPETLLFNKSRTVFALHLAKQAIQKEDLAILAEGQMDVIMLHQAGYNQAVASSGTALTAQQLRLIARFSTNIAFAYDGDHAGREATKRGLELALQEELNPYVISIPDGKDPADSLQQNPAAWETAYQKRQPFMEWLLNELLPADAPLTPQLKKEVAREIIPWLRQIKSSIEQADWLRIVAARLQTDAKNLEEALSRQAASSAPVPVASQAEPTPESQAQSAPLSPIEQRAELGLALLITFPNLYPKVASQLSQNNLPSTPFITQFFTRFPSSTEDFPAALTALSEAEQKELSLQVETILQPYQEIELTETYALEEILVILQRFRSESKESAKSEMAKQISAAQAAGNMERVKELLADLKNLI